MAYFLNSIHVILALILLTIVEAKNGKLRFVLLGDIGGVPYWPYSLWTQRLVSYQISQIPNVDFFVCAGDNFYYRGVRNVNDFRFFATYENVYSYPSLQKNWYMVAGNHDYAGNVSAQIMYTQKSKRWKFPYFYHTKVFDIPKTNKTLQLLMIDTMSLCFPRIIKHKNAPSPEVQMKWIEETLNKSRADYLVAVGHHPMFSAGIHGSTQCIQDKLQELFKQHRVNAYVSGHDHNLQHIIPTNSSLEHFVSGAANFYHNSQINKPELDPNSLKFFVGNKPGFLLVTAKKDKIKFELRTVNPNERYKRILPPRQELPKYVKQKFPKLLKDFFKTFQGDHSLGLYYL